VSRAFSGKSVKKVSRVCLIIGIFILLPPSLYAV
jgi:hypothetical protein